MRVLVDAQLNAKLADLELGIDTRKSESEGADEAIFKDDFLINWIAPEVKSPALYDLI